MFTKKSCCMRAIKCSNKLGQVSGAVILIGVTMPVANADQESAASVPPSSVHSVSYDEGFAPSTVGKSGNDVWFTRPIEDKSKDSVGLAPSREVGFTGGLGFAPSPEAKATFSTGTQGAASRPTSTRLLSNDSVNGAGIGRQSYSCGFTGGGDTVYRGIYAGHGTASGVLPHTSTSSVDIDITGSGGVTNEVFQLSQSLGISGQELQGAIEANSLRSLLQFKILSTRYDVRRLSAGQRAAAGL
jgi:hypothetical protein